MDNRPIGVFDSGVGGLTVLSQLLTLLPYENYVYFGDTARVPYGSKNEDTIIKYSKEAASFLISKDVKLIVIACNTATSMALDTLENNLSIPVQGVIKPGAKAGVYNTKTGEIGVIGTEGTVKSGAYTKEILKYDDSLVVDTKACPLFVPIVEEGLENTEIARDSVKMYMDGIKSTNIDTLILGCTHYPILINTIKAFVGENIQLVNPAFETAKEVKTTLMKNEMLKGDYNYGKVEYYVSDDPEKFKSVGGKIVKMGIDKVTKVEIDKY